MTTIFSFGDLLRKVVRGVSNKRSREGGEVTLNDYVALYYEQVASGERRTQKGVRFSQGTVRSVKQMMVQLNAFQTYMGRVYDWDDVDYAFRTAFLNYMYEVKRYNVNTAAKCINTLVTVLAAAYAEGCHQNMKCLCRQFKARRMEVDNVYLTKEELEAVKGVDLSGLSEMCGKARDLFLVGVYTAQRVSDYNNIGPENIVWCEDGGMIINLKQKKTGVWVAIPVKDELRAILEKYDYRLPRMAHQTLNHYIKVVAREAGIDEPVTVQTTRGGIPVLETKPKSELVHSHTARRTGATLMYLAGMDAFNICSMTGHSSVAMLRRYIKADKFERARVIRRDEAFDKW